MIFSSCVTLKFERWPWKIIGHFFYATSSFVHHFVAFGEFKLELQSGKAQFGSKWTFFMLCDLEIWRITLKNNRSPLLSTIKLCASFYHHMWIQTRVIVRKLQMWFWPLWPWILTSDLDILLGYHLCHWQKLLKISWWYNERNIVKKVW